MAERGWTGAPADSPSQVEPVLDALRQGVLFQDAAGVITAVNPAAERLLGKAGAALLGQTSEALPDAIREDGAPLPVAEHPAMVALRTGREQRDVVLGVFDPREARYRWISATAVPVVRPGASGPHLVCTLLEDVTERREAERARRDARAILGAVIESTDALVFTLDGQYRYTSFNERHRKLMEGLYGTQVAVGLRILDLMTVQEDREAARRNVDRALAGEDVVEEAFSGEVNRVRHYFRVAHRPIRTEAGDIIGVVVTASDVTERRRQEEALLESERRYRDLVTLSPDAILLSRDDVVAFANPAALELFGASAPEQLVGRGAMELFHPDYHELIRARKRNALAGQLSPRVEEKIIRLDGAVRDVEVAAAAFDDAAGRAIQVILRDVTDRKRAEAALRETERRAALRERELRFQALIERATDMIAVLDGEGVIRFWSPGAQAALGWREDELLDRRIAELHHPDDEPGAGRRLQELLATPGSSVRHTMRLRHKDGTWRTVESVGRNLMHDPSVRGVIVNSRDVTEERRLEERFREAQRLESIGRLAGGIAHDFNNLLTAILGGAEAVGEDLAQGRAVSLEDVEAVRDAGNRARELTRQLLAFARRQVIVPTPLDVNAFLAGAEKLLRRLLPETVELSVRSVPGLWRVLCDPGQLQQVIVNLAVNARDAMPAGGRLEIAPCNLELDEEASRTLAVPEPGDYVRITVRDTGEGMAEEVRAHAFEPFFTTKAHGHGTGLGLATVYGIVRQSNGHVTLESERGRGTTFHVYLPRTSAESEQPSPPPPARATGTETVLVAEDEPLVRGIAVRALRRAGFQVLVASDAAEALAAADGLQGRLDLLVTDIVMPGINGHDLAQSLVRRRPGLKVLYVSGYTQDALGHDGVLETGVEFLPKPFTATSLLARVRAVLDGK